jgi:hypothetical protein
MDVAWGDMEKRLKRSGVCRYTSRQARVNPSGSNPAPGVADLPAQGTAADGGRSRPILRRRSL